MASLTLLLNISVWNTKQLIFLIPHSLWPECFNNEAETEGEIHLPAPASLNMHWLNISIIVFECRRLLIGTLYYYSVKRD